MDQDVVGQLEAVLLQACMGGEAGLDDALLGVDAGASCLVVGALPADQVYGIRRHGQPAWRCCAGLCCPVMCSWTQQAKASALFCKHCSNDHHQQSGATDRQYRDGLAMLTIIHLVYAG